MLRLNKGANVSLSAFANKKMSEALVCVADYEKLAKKILPRNALSYFKSGAGDEQSLKDNVKAFKRWRFRPRVLRDVSNIDMSTSLLGTNLPFPILVASTAMNRMAHPDGELASARAAFRLGTCFTLSSWATTSIEEIAENLPNLKRWFQLYVYNDRNLTKQLVERAKKHGFKVLVLTVDTPVLGSRYQDGRIKFSLPSHLKLQNFQDQAGLGQLKGKEASGLAEYCSKLIDPALSWEVVDWLRTITDLPIVVKGIITGEMALEAVEHGVEGIVVSNHGARQLDGVTSTIDALPEIVRAVKGRCEVYMDGGVRNGGDVAKAIALGAKAVFIGRPIIWGMTCEGENGARRVLEILCDEFQQTMQLLGVRSISELQTAENLVMHERRLFAKL